MAATCQRLMEQMLVVTVKLLLCCKMRVPTVDESDCVVEEV